MSVEVCSAESALGVADAGVARAPFASDSPPVLAGESEYPPACTAVSIERVGTIFFSRRCVSVNGSQSRTRSRGRVLGGDDLRAGTVLASTEQSTAVVILQVGRLVANGSDGWRGRAGPLNSRLRCPRVCSSDAESSWMMRVECESARRARECTPGWPSVAGRRTRADSRCRIASQGRVRGCSREVDHSTRRDTRDEGARGRLQRASERPCGRLA